LRTLTSVASSSSFVMSTLPIFSAMAYVAPFIPLAAFENLWPRHYPQAAAAAISASEYHFDIFSGSTRMLSRSWTSMEFGRYSLN
jgi:hypothetical protein